MKTIKYTVLLLAIATMASCQKEEMNPTYDNDPSAVKINAAVDAITTRSNPLEEGTASTTFNSGDMIAVSAVGQSAVKYTYNGSSWTPEAGEYLKWNTSSMTFSAYYPASVNDASMTTFTLPKDQSTLEAIQNADYMTYTGSQEKAESISLTLQRKMARVVVTPTLNDQYKTGYTVEKIVVTGNTDGYSQGQPIGGRMAYVTSYRNSNGKFYALLTPTSESNSEVFLTVTVKKTDGGNTEILTVKSIPTINAGKSCEIALSVGKTMIKITSVTVKDWGDEVVIPGGEADWNVDVWDGTIAGAYNSGIGTKEDPYIIATGAQLAKIANEYQTTSYFKLTRDIDLNNLDWTPIGANPTKMFFGSFDGNNHTITGLKVTATNEVKYTGLFGIIASKKTGTDIKTIKNLTIKDAQIYAKMKEETQGIGILVGYSTRDGGGEAPGYGHSSIENCHVSGTIHSASDVKKVGGLVGTPEFALIENCSAEIKIEGYPSLVGGLVGFASGTIIRNCSVKGSLQGQYTVGGFAGNAMNSADEVMMIIENCTADVAITANNWNVGGFVGWNNAKITNCTASGNVNSPFNWENHIYRTGGFAGTNAGTISSSVYTGAMTFLDNAQYYGGFVGNDNGGTTNGCKFDGTKNPNLNANGLSTKNQSIGTNDIKNSLE